MKRALLLLSVLAFVVVGQHWEIEQVDSAGWGGGVKMGFLDDGRLILGYAHGGRGDFRLAYRDSGWTTEDIPAHLDDVEAISFAVGDSDRMGFGCSRWDTIHYMVKSDSGWGHFPITGSGFEAPGEFGRFPSAFDSTNRPVALVRGWSSSVAILSLAQDTWELIDSYGISPTSATYPVQMDRYGEDELWGLVVIFVNAIGLRQTWLKRFAWDGYDWNAVTVAGGDFAHMNAPSAALDLAGGIHACCWCDGVRWPDGFGYDAVLLDGSYVARSAVAFDHHGRPLVAYLRDGTLMFCYRRSGRWYYFTVDSEVGSVDVKQGPDGQPWIAYCSSRGLFLARGVDITGVEEKPEVGSQNAEPRMPTVMQASELARVESRVFDMTGREVVDRRLYLAPGIYFVRMASGVKCPALRVAKVVVAR